jgi:hypothetical protein
VRVPFLHEPEELIHPKWAAHFAGAPAPQGPAGGAVRDPGSQEGARDGSGAPDEDGSSVDLAPRGWFAPEVNG